MRYKLSPAATTPKGDIAGLHPKYSKTPFPERELSAPDLARCTNAGADYIL
jgi:hypothetical protein